MEKEKGLETDIEFPLPQDRSTWTVAQHWFHNHCKEHGTHDHFMAPFQDWVVSGEVWVFTQKGDVEHCHGAALRFGNHSGVVIGSLCLVAPLPSFKDDDEYDDWDKTPLEKAMACSFSQTIHGVVGSGFSCVFRVYPFQLERLRRLAKLGLVAKLDSFLGAHLRLCLGN
jgi:hypothetical protein